MNKRCIHEEKFWFKTFSILYIAIMCFTFFVCAAAITGCQSTKAVHVADGTEVIVGNQVATTKSEDTVNNLTDTINDGNETVGGAIQTSDTITVSVSQLESTVSGSKERLDEIVKTSNSITDSTERLEYLFDSYESEINRILSEVEQIRRQDNTTETTTK